MKLKRQSLQAQIAECRLQLHTYRAVALDMTRLQEPVAQNQQNSSCLAIVRGFPCLLEAWAWPQGRQAQAHSPESCKHSTWKCRSRVGLALVIVTVYHYSSDPSMCFPILPATRHRVYSPCRGLPPCQAGLCVSWAGKGRRPHRGCLHPAQPSGVWPYSECCPPEHQGTSQPALGAPTCHVLRIHKLCIYIMTYWLSQPPAYLPQQEEYRYGWQVECQGELQQDLRTKPSAMHCHQEQACITI